MDTVPITAVPLIPFVSKRGTSSCLMESLFCRLSQVVFITCLEMFITVEPRLQASISNRIGQGMLLWLVRVCVCMCVCALQLG